MNLALTLRRWVPLIALLAVAIAAWQTAHAADIDDVRDEPIAYDEALTTPVLSARRAPEAFRAPVIDDEVRLAVNNLIAATGDYPSCLVAEVDDRLLGSKDPLVPLIPASNQKLLTTYAALVVFGPDHRFTTSLRTEGDITNSVLNGDLYLVGGGDPFLSTDDWWTQYEEGTARFHTRLEDLADAVVAAGITQVTGSLLGDESLFDQQRVGPWAERLITQKQSGPLSALAVNEGHTAWPEEFLSMSARTQTDDPARHAAQTLAGLLADRGIAVGGTGVGPTPVDAALVGAVNSPPLIDLITHVNSYSNNYGAELMLKHLGHDRSGVGSTAAGADATEATLRAQGFNLAGVVIEDGSGLAETNRVTCQLLADLLDTAGAGSAFAESLSVGGERGSLRLRLDETLADGLAFAKTGTLNTVTALSGYVESSSEDNTAIIFAYLVNGEIAGVGAGINNELVSIQAPFVVELAEYPVGPTIEDLGPREPVPAG